MYFIGRSAVLEEIINVAPANPFKTENNLRFERKANFQLQ